MAKALKESESFSQSPPERPQVVWSGEGGSVLLGLVHISETILELMRAGNIDGAIEEFLQRENIHVPPKLFRSQILENISMVIKQGIRED